MVCGYGAFQKHMSLAFFQGAAMRDPGGFFVREDAPAKSMRRMKFTHVHEVDARVITVYVREAISLNSSGIGSAARSLELPADLNKLLRNNKTLLKFFESLSYAHRKEYIRWIKETKKDETRQARLKKTIEMFKQKVRHP